MRVSIYTGNHGNAHGITDLVCLLRNAVRDCGYDVCVSHVPLKDHCNILIENFEQAEQVEKLVRCKTPGTRYVLIGSELITNSSFNAGMDGSHWHYSNRDYWKCRFEGFMAVASLADAIWVLGEGAVDAYAKTVPNKPVRFMPHGHVENFGLVQHRAPADKDIDFYFSGSLTDYRVAILRALAKNYSVAFNEQATPDYLRMDLMARAKVCLSLRLSPKNAMPSVSRIHFHIQNRNYLLQDTYAASSCLDPYVLHAPNDDFVEWAIASLEVTNRPQVAEATLARFKADMPMTRWMHPLLAEAVGNLELLRPIAPRLAA
jgi:hypothetical protein